MIVAICWLAVVVVLLTLGLSSQEPLDPGVSIDDPVVLEKMQSDLVKQFIHDRKLFEDRVLLKHEWRARQEYLLRRYIDITRRLDHVRAV